VIDYDKTALERAAAKRTQKNLTRVLNSFLGGFKYSPATQSHPDGPTSTRGERRRAKLGRT
jgi:hypothetical protein